MIRSRTMYFVLPVMVTFSACQADTPEATFVSSCSASLGEAALQVNKSELCSCIFSELKDSFSGDQMNRISRFFSEDIPAAEKSLKQSGSASDLDILTRINDIKVATDGCFKAMK